MGLKTVFDEEGMAHVFVRNVVHDGQVMYTMNCNSSIEGMVYCALLDIRLTDVSNHMEMNWIPTKSKCLTSIEKLEIFNASHGGLITWREYKYVRSVSFRV